jgi:hypothetical protein
MNDCWIWEGKKTSQGYGRICLNGKDHKAHRLSYEIFIGPIPEGHCVCHYCDNPQCWNPSHLFIGTFADNQRDKVLKGRSWRGIGEKNPNAKLSLNEVKAIRSEKGSCRFIAKRFGIGKSQVSNILKGAHWREET